MVAFNINLDSIASMVGWKNIDDPTFTTIMDRFFKLSDKYKFKYSIYVIGTDLLTKQNRDIVKSWHDNGHEIGNHSYTHPLNLGSLPYKQIENEVLRTGDLIKEAIGEYPKGFTAPGWSTSSALLKALSFNGYEYDASSFPTILLYPSMIQMLTIAGNQIGNILDRKDWLNPIFGKKECHKLLGLTELPLPTNRYGIAVWHTLSFILGWKMHSKLIKSCMENESFYYLMHPADLIDIDEVPRSARKLMARGNFTLKDKTRLLENSIELILSSRRKPTSMYELSKKCGGR